MRECTCILIPLVSDVRMCDCTCILILLVSCENVWLYLYPYTTGVICENVWLYLYPYTTGVRCENMWLYLYPYTTGVRCENVWLYLYPYTTGVRRENVWLYLYPYTTGVRCENVWLYLHVLIHGMLRSRSNRTRNAFEVTPSRMTVNVLKDNVITHTHTRALSRFCVTICFEINCFQRALTIFLFFFFSFERWSCQDVILVVMFYKYMKDLHKEKSHEYQKQLSARMLRWEPRPFAGLVNLDEAGGVSMMSTGAAHQQPQNESWPNRGCPLEGFSKVLASKRQGPFHFAISSSCPKTMCNVDPPPVDRSATKG